MLNVPLYRTLCPSAAKRSRVRQSFLRSVLLCGTLLTVAVANASWANSDSSVKTVKDTVKQPLTISLNKGQVFSVIAPLMSNSPEGDAARKEYYRTVVPAGTKLGLKREGQIAVGATLVGNFKPKALVFFSWPDQKAEDALSNDPRWPQMKALRPQGWDVLNIYSKELTQDVEFNFSAAKHYTLAMAWVNENNPSDYARYLKMIEPAVKETGGRFIYAMKNPRFESHGVHSIPPKNAKHAGPSQLTLVEWDGEDGIRNFQKSKLFKTYSPLIASGTHRFELFKLGL